MKRISFILSIGVFFYSALLLHAESFGQQVLDQSGIEGTVVLVPRETPPRTGIRYGRPANTTSTTEPAPDSVLLWIESTDNEYAPDTEKHTILDQQDLKFRPSLLAVPLHGTVRIRNSDPVYHNVFSLSSIKRFNVGRRPKGEFLDITFDKPGIVDVFCDIHSNMRATIYVMPNDTFKWTKIKSGEAFTFDNIPPGSYKLQVYAMGYQGQSVSVEVTSGEVTDIGTLTLNF